MSINVQQLESLINRVLLELDEETGGKIKVSPEAVDLIMMTAAHESHLGTFIKQVRGPALGIFQMEPFTHDDHWIYIRDRKWLRDTFERLKEGRKDAGELEWNLKYAILLTRIHYYRKPEALPSKELPTKEYRAELAKYAKAYYNTVAGKATWEAYLQDYLTFVVKT